jgi:3-oxoacyl-[acyl-carrier protein] reductase
MNRLKDKNAIVTGASKGIGAAIAKGLAEAGAAVAVNYASDKVGADRVVTEIVEKGGRAIAIKAEMSSAAEVERLFEETRMTLGQPSVLVNNAGIFEFDPVENISEEQFHRHFNVNVLAAILAVQRAVKYFPVEGGSIVNISSIASKTPNPNTRLYASSKGAIDTLTLALARELGQRQIRVNAVAPGYTDTEGNRRIGFVGSATAEMLVAGTPLGARLGSSEEIARVVVFLASDDAAWLTGERINASGGIR